MIASENGLGELGRHYKAPATDLAGADFGPLRTVIPDAKRLLIGVFLGMKLVIPVMVRAGRGSIINSSSIAGLTLCAYFASKHAVLGLTRTAAVEWGAKGIRVNCINPGPIESRMMASIEKGASPDAPKAVHDGFAQTIPMKRYGTPEEVAGVVAFLASDDSGYVNGAYHTIDGGITAA